MAVLTQNPIPYHAGLYREENWNGKIDITLFYCSTVAVEPTVLEDMGDVEVEWDVALLKGYESHFLRNFERPDLQASSVQ